MTYQLAVFLLYLFVFLFGSVIASFLNVVIYRLPLGISVAKGRSFCPACKKTLKPYDMIPVLSWFFLKGKCRFCGARISFRYPVVEFLGGFLTVLSFCCLGFTAYGVLVAISGLLLLTLAWIDWDTMTIPDVFHFCFIILCLAGIFLNPHFSWLSAFIGAVEISLPMLLLSLFIPGAFGFGDVKLMCICGFFLGWQLTLVAFFLALLLGGGYGIFLLYGRKKNKKSHFPFGPFLAVGIFTALLWGNSIITWYCLLLFA